MKLKVFQSGKGDCLQVTSGDGTKRILVDGGMCDAYKEFVAPAMGDLATAQKAIDLVYVSHIDEDHISGILQLLDDKVSWTVHDFQLQNNNPAHPEPKSPRPPKVKDIWHNAFHAMVEENIDEITDLLAASASILSGSSDFEFKEIAIQQNQLATSIPQAIQVSRRISNDQLGIPLNRQFNGKLAFISNDDLPPHPPIQMGPLNVYVIGPFDKDLDKLRHDWNKWLKNNREALEKLEKKAQRDAERLGTSDALTLLNLRLAQAQELGDRSKVTPPNLASLMVLIEENNKTLLLTGDGHSDDILKGLKYHGKLDAENRIHVNVLKVQHHGSENNINEYFVSKVTAEDYIFCANGEHMNPDLKALSIIIESRLGAVNFHADNPQATGSFKLWFNSSESASKKSDAKLHMREVKKLVTEREISSDGRMSTEFLEEKNPYFELVI